MNTAEQAAVARLVADYIIDHVLVDEPIYTFELEFFAKEITEDRGEWGAEDVKAITRIVIDYVSNDPKVAVKRVKERRWYYHR